MLPDELQKNYSTIEEWFDLNVPKVRLMNTDMVVTTYVYREKFFFQRLLKDQCWYVTYMNQIIGHGIYRHDLEEWINTEYPDPNTCTEDSVHA
jgi:hypothetical protein